MSEKKDNENARRIQATTGLIIALFATAHLSNHLSMHFGLETHTYFFKKFRAIYASKPAETLLLSSILIHSLNAFRLYKGLPKQWDKLLFQLSGYFLLLAMPGHIYFTRVPRETMKDLDVTFVTMTARYLPFFFIPYYCLLGASGAIHMISGLGRAGHIIQKVDFLSKIFPSGGKRYYQWALFFSLAMVSSVFAISGLYFKFPIPEEASLKIHTLTKWPKFLANRLYF